MTPDPLSPLAGRGLVRGGGSAYLERPLTRLLRAWPDIQVISTGTGRMHATDILALSIDAPRPPPVGGSTFRT